MHRIISKIQPQPDLTLLVTFATGEIVSFDVRSLFDKYPVFKRLEEDRALFESVKIDGIGFGISWDDTLDLSSDGIFLRGKHVGKTDPDVRVALGQALIAAREKASLSQRELAKISGVMQAEISKIEQGRGNPTLLTLQKLAKPLGVTIASLLES